jgi:bifunctional non-homologous end joining protein LigD
MAKLAEYRAKRDFTKTSEPKGKETRRRASLFVVQKHDASRLHYDFRLELDGVLKSWAVAKGPSLVPGEKRLAIHVEDHPLSYGEFEGTIPEGEYGGGTVMLWDRGSWQPEGDPRKSYAKGRLTFRLDGEKLKGIWHLVRMRRRPRERQESWLLIKGEDAFAREPGDPDLLETDTLSVKSGRNLDEIAAGTKAQVSGKTATRKGAAPAKGKAPAKRVARRATDTQSSAMPSAIEPSLATLVDAVPKGSQWIHEIKWDGYRLLAFLKNGKAQLKTRNGLDWTTRFPAIAKAIGGLSARAAILDGEAVVEDERGVSSFSALQQALSNSTKGKAASAVFHAFDLLYLDGEDLRPLPLEERKTRLFKLIKPSGVLRLSEHLAGSGPAVLRNACRLGLEGVVSKRRDLPYRSGRNGDWVKTKCTERQEFVIAGFVPSTAIKRAVGSLVLGYYEGDRLIYAGRAGTGFTAEIARDLYKKLKPPTRKEPPFASKLDALQRRGVIFVEPRLVGEVEFRGWTADKVVRHAAFKGLREDKTVREVVQEKRAASRKRSKPTKTKLAETKPAGTKPAPAGTVEVAGVTLTHPDRVLWAEQGVTKQGLAEFYVEIADWVLPHVVNRPLALVRCPSGAEKSCFFQKHSWAGLSDFILRDKVRSDDGAEEVLLVRDIKGIVALVQAGVLEIHPWGATIDKIERPDRLIFDFDPGEGTKWSDVIEGGRELRDRLKSLGLESFAKLSGGKGLHVVVPLTPRAGWDEVRNFARTLSEAMEADHGGRYLTKAAKSERAGKIFIDYLRNGRGATAVAAYSTRARVGAPVATPMAWDELSDAVKPNHFTVENLPARLDALNMDPWTDFFKIKQSLPAMSATSSGRPKPRRKA